jgi:hypothetical protein
MPKELPDLLTPVSQEGLIRGFWQTWLDFFNTAPTKESIWLLVAHAKLECGLKYVHNYNLGNVKSKDGDGYDYQFFTCGEELVLADAQRAASKDPRITIGKTYVTDDGVQMASVSIAPKHPGCRFRAFTTLQAGMLDHLRTVYGRFQAAWPAVLAGDPAAYAHALKQQRYYTANESKYTAILRRCFLEVSNVSVDYYSLPVLSKKEAADVQAQVAASLADIVKETQS